MNKKTNDLVLLILGSDDPNYDGFTISGSYNNSHIKTIKKLADVLSSQGFEVGRFDPELAEEAAFNLVKNGHIVFFNADILAFIKIPKEITAKQFAVLEILEDELKNYNLYVQHLEPITEEAFTSKQYRKDFKLNPIEYKIKDRK